MKKRGPLWGNTTLLCHLRRPDPPVISPWQLFIRIHEQDLHAAHLSTDKDRWCDRDLAPAHSPGFNELFLNWLKHPSWLDQSLGPVLGAGGELTCPEGHHGGIPRLLTQRKINDSLYINTQIYLAFPCQLPFQGMQISVPKGWGITEFPSPVEHQSSPSKLQQQLNHSSSPGISGSGGERVVTVPQHVRLGAP